ncbi:hypothetical protein [Cytobacillus solani]|uniref:Zinc-ribbon domain-containing protein n=1 Tax=Cytobacillus solani TaxID=1637975 RepID=A0A0Q3T2E9_9BACI|nr:hypothetical protein [Cytobacillus solani]KQL17653.1 hypothetical protein AN957_02840 [Cytobacillus solani]
MRDHPVIEQMERTGYPYPMDKEYELEEDQTEEMECPVCSNEEIEDHHNFCKICGTEIEK